MTWGMARFSHVSEMVLDELSGAQGVHEAISAHIIRTNDHFLAAFGEDTCNRAADLIERIGPRTYMRDVVSGPTDADKLDYLLRDSRYAGVTYGEYDLRRLIDPVTIIDFGQPDYLGFKADGIWAVEGLLLARHHMHRQVYGHKTRRATDIMLTRALRLGVEEGLLDAAAYRVELDASGSPIVTSDFLGAYLAQTDEVVLTTLANGPETWRPPTLPAASGRETCCVNRRASCFTGAKTNSVGNATRISAILKSSRVLARLS